MMASVTGAIRKVLSPAFYAAQWNAVVSATRAKVRVGSVEPLFQACLLVGVTGYCVEYVTVGRYHVMDKQALIKKAMADHHH